MKVASTQMGHLRVEVGKGFTRTVKGSDLVGPKDFAKCGKKGKDFLKRNLPNIRKEIGLIFPNHDR